MRGWSFLLALSALSALPLPGLAAEATDQDLFRKRVDKFADESSFVDRPKRLCVCLDDDNPADERMAGVVVENLVVGSDNARRIQVRCFVRRFLSSGAGTTSEACSSTWVLLH